MGIFGDIMKDIKKKPGYAGGEGEEEIEEDQGTLQKLIGEKKKSSRRKLVEVED